MALNYPQQNYLSAAVPYVGIQNLWHASIAIYAFYEEFNELI